MVRWGVASALTPTPTEGLVAASIAAMSIEGRSQDAEDGSDQSGQSDLPVLVIDQALDFDRDPALYRRLSRAVCEHAATGFILDLQGCSYVDRTGLAELVALVHGARKNGVPIVLARPPASVTRILEMTRLTRFFTVVATLEEAKAVI